jgi:hypothetical protein
VSNQSDPSVSRSVRSMSIISPPSAQVAQPSVSGSHFILGVCICAGAAFVMMEAIAKLYVIILI